MSLTAPIILTSPDITTSATSMDVYNDIFQDEDMQSTESGRVVAQPGGVPVGVDCTPQTSPDASSNSSIGRADILSDLHLPRFIKSLPSHLDVDDLHYLKARRCFAFLPADLEKIVIRRYAEFIHPLVPVLDFDDFVDVVFGDVQKKISLLLYHAVMCAGLAAVDIQTILDYGFDSKVAARKQYYTKAKVLFDMDVETDRLVACQAALLLISWGSNEHSRDPFYWMGIAISQACSLKIHKAESDANLPKNDQLLRQRIWWTIIMKECDICLTLGRPPRISPHRTPLLQHEAFMNRSQTTNYSHLPETGKLRRDPWIQRRLEMAWIEKAKLAIIIYRILRLSCSSDDFVNCQSNRNARIWQLESELKDWRLQLPMELTSFNTALNLSEDADRSLQMTMSILHLTQLMALIMLHKSEVSISGWTKCLQNGEDWLEDNEALDAQGHTKSVRQAASEITAIHKALHEQQLTPSMPTTGIATVCTAVFVHLLDARSTGGFIRNSALEHLDTCLTILRELGQMNEAATDVTRIVESAVQAARGSSATPASQEYAAASPSGTSGSGRSRFTNECATPSFMEGVVPDQLPSHQLPVGSLSTTRDSFGSAFELGGQDLFYGIENFFDFELIENVSLLAGA
ncbi:uncharacterized protein Z519_08749 [Cladophialophora bantiana CBS 173.52]|uniref:Xylanolytic transcriptional activator regulatory domain-containing protein n=1 Tax=Cladophialophora bantiana (strain ATCC 10958 / CBS 173.52 / CDC B-1940 / NIH 8579) TaxID=1442370 RepID=A0A0D2ELW7_CLAB1|nr:uncharacterized protein Z519_08749 [Cladophialophora bantiana CBS 173.52]KIW90966.1 hypothetical protein Z519_08749 [Cladophialophora bantiana CBS 173.52]